MTIIKNIRLLCYSEIKGNRHSISEQSTVKKRSSAVVSASQGKRVSGIEHDPSASLKGLF